MHTLTVNTITSLQRPSFDPILLIPFILVVCCGYLPLRFWFRIIGRRDPCGVLAALVLIKGLEFLLTHDYLVVIGRRGQSVLYLDWRR